jgi:transposase
MTISTSSGPSPRRVGRKNRTALKNLTVRLMEGNKENSFSHYILATSEFRQLGKVEQAVYLKLNNASPSKVHKDTKVSRYAIIRGLKASAAGREIGKKGRPTKLNEEQIKVFIDRVQEELQNGSEINYELAILMVWILSFKMEILTFVLGRERLVHLEL